VSVHLCWVLVGVVVLCFFAIAREDARVSPSDFTVPSPWPVIMFLLAVICVLLICMLHMAICC
jgi:hypothetical protein